MLNNKIPSFPPPKTYLTASLNSNEDFFITKEWASLRNCSEEVEIKFYIHRQHLQFFDSTLNQFRIKLSWIPPPCSFRMSTTKKGLEPHFWRRYAKKFHLKWEISHPLPPIVEEFSHEENVNNFFPSKIVILHVHIVAEYWAASISYTAYMHAYKFYFSWHRLKVSNTFPLSSAFVSVV
jgi:hypothetical protein